MNSPVSLALPTGKIQSSVLTLLQDAGISINSSARSYRPRLSLPLFETKMLKPQNIIEMLAMGRRDVGFAGFDWVAELKCNVVELLDTTFDPVRVVVAAPSGFPEAPTYRGREVVIATEYVSLAKRWIDKKGLAARVVRSYGATEVFPPEDADAIIDNMATGATLEAANLKVIDTVLSSSTRLYASPQALECPSKRKHIEDFTLLVRSVLDARNRVMVEVNVSGDCLESVAALLPCMKTPTISPLYRDQGFVVKAAVIRSALPQLIPLIKEAGGTDIVVTELSNVIP